MPFCAAEAMSDQLVKRLKFIEPYPEPETFDAYTRCLPLYTTLVKSFSETQPERGVASAPVDVQRYVEGSVQVGLLLLLLLLLLGALGDVLGLPAGLLLGAVGLPAGPLQVTPLSAKSVGTGLEPFHEPLNPKDALPLVGMLAL